MLVSANINAAVLTSTAAMVKHWPCLCRGGQCLTMAASGRLALSWPPLAASGRLALSWPPLAASGRLALSWPPLAASGRPERTAEKIENSEISEFSKIKKFGRFPNFSSLVIMQKIFSESFRKNLFQCYQALVARNENREGFRARHAALPA